MNLIRKIPSKNSEVNKMGLYYGFASTFGFTPEQVDELDVFTLQSFLIIAESQAKEQERMMKNAGRC